MLTKKITKADVGFGLFAYTILTFLSLCCLIPFLFIISGAFSSEQAILEHGFSLIPIEYSL